MRRETKLGILNFRLRKKSLHGKKTNKETMPTRKRILGYLLLSMLLCHTTLTGAEEVKIDRTEKIEYEKTAHAVYKELVNPVLVHKNADGSDVHPDKNIVCGHFTRETDLTIGSLNKTLTDLTDNDKKIYDKTIEKVEMTTGENEAAISMIQRDKNVVEGSTITYKNGGGTAGENTWVSVGNGTTSKKLNTGSVVSTTSQENASLKDLTINGKKYLAAVSMNQQNSLSSIDAQVQNQSENAIALGNQAQANHHNDVALGSGSSTKKATATRGMTIDGAYYGFAGAGPTSTVSIGAQGKERTLTNVAAGRVQYDSTDAVNGSQLYATNQAVETLSRRINKIGANAAAMAALHPLDFDPDDKWDFAAGIGRYRGVNAVALGVFYRPNEDTMISISGNVGSGDNMVNAGISLKIGQGNHVSASRVAMAKEIKELRSELEAMKSAMLDAHVGKKVDTSKLQLFPDVPQNHWAYEYVAQLAGNGMIEGYPDGNFAGDRPMTRYEFAAILYRAMTKGAVLSDKILSEFSHELEYFTVDTVSKDKAGNPTIQRVRTVKANKNK